METSPRDAVQLNQREIEAHIQKQKITDISLKESSELVTGFVKKPLIYSEVSCGTGK